MKIRSPDSTSIRLFCERGQERERKVRKGEKRGGGGGGEGGEEGEGNLQSKLRRSAPSSV